ncbi:sperm-egg fusion protein TMEM95 [Apodemus sylvaticus]|uniref:sperm-egg fusion protein TMEM95 n=1 Tax=Apodemus sylvaticus TaxID=10129 RepID=UPI00224192AE|nr:sperm-egg fusion protein TMEM95 [Apodemus sylvaticus]
MWVLALGGVFLAAAKACIFCRLPDRDLSGRLAQLNSQMEPQRKEVASPDFSAFALDEVSLNQITEKTHRVLRVIEIKRSISLLPLYWQWLQKTKIPQYTREALCAPVCPLLLLSPAGGSTILYNCSTCQGMEESCWSQKRCFPGSLDLWDARILLLCIFGIVLFLGALSLQVE